MQGKRESVDNMGIRKFDERWLKKKREKNERKVVKDHI